MRVLYIADRGDEGGAARAIIEVVTNLQAMGVSPVVCTGTKNSLNDTFTELGITNFASCFYPAMNPKSPYLWKRPLKYPYELMQYYLAIYPAMKNISGHVDMNTIDIIHTNSARNDIGCLLSKKYHVPHVMHLREFGQEDFNCCIYRPDYYSFISRYTSRFIAISEAVKHSWISKGINAQITQVVPNGVDTEKIEVSDPARFDRENLSLIIAGGVCEAKGQHIALEAIGRLAPQVRDKVTLDIAGWSDKVYIPKLEAIISKYNLNNITFSGTRTDLYQTYKNYDIGLMCSRSEGFGRVTAEYMYAGLGVIASDTGASPELVTDGATGQIYRQDDPEDLARCITRYFYDRGLLRTHALNAHEDAARRFTAQRNARDILNVYREVLAQSTPST